MLSFTIGRESITVLIDGEFNSIDRSHANFPALKAELQKEPQDRDLDAIRTFIKIKTMLEHLSIGRVTVFEDEIQFDGVPVHSYMTERMLEILADGIDITPWVRFMDNLFDNPESYVIAELYQWMEKAKMPLTPDGCFLAFKKVRSDYTDCHTGRFDNSPGTVIEMPREDCDKNRDNTCSTGFHFCSIGYLGHFGGSKVVITKHNPKHITSIPSDYKFTKGRCHRYEVIGELNGQSAAAHKVWQKGVLALENPQEYPADVIKNVTFADHVTPADSDKSDFDPGDCVQIVSDTVNRGHVGKTGTVVWCPPNKPENIYVRIEGYGDALYSPHELMPVIEINISAEDEAMVSAAIEESSRRLAAEEITAEMKRKGLSIDMDKAREAAAQIEAGMTDALYSPECKITPAQIAACKPVIDLTDEDIDLIAGTGPNAEAMKADLRAQREQARIAQRDAEFDLMVETGNFTIKQQVPFIQADLSKTAETGKIGFKTTMVDHPDAETVFVTNDGREFAGSVIKAALEDASIRGAARNLGIQDSTLRGWKKKLGL